LRSSATGISKQLNKAPKEQIQEKLDPATYTGMFQQTRMSKGMLHAKGLTATMDNKNHNTDFANEPRKPPQAALAQLFKIRLVGPYPYSEAASCRIARAP